MFFCNARRLKDPSSAHLQILCSIPPPGEAVSPAKDGEPAVAVVDVCLARLKVEKTARAEQGVRMLDAAIARYAIIAGDCGASRRITSDVPSVRG
jgi:hypothetical protein